MIILGGVKMISLSDIAGFIEEIAPVRLAESWDNVGLMVGSMDSEVKRVLVCLDVTSEVVNEAVQKKVDLILSHHPFIFGGLKKLDGKDPKGRLIHMLIKNSISVYSAHTNLDFARGGINDYLAELLGLSEAGALKSYKSDKLFKLVVFVPKENADAVRDAMSMNGAGWIGNYSDCSFMINGVGTFRPLEGTNPYIGTKGKLEKTDEVRIETIVKSGDLNKVVGAMIKVHPYEEVAYDVYPLEIPGEQYGMGNLGILQRPLLISEFIELVKQKLNIKNVRLIGNLDKQIERVAVFCGSFDPSLIGAVKSKADIIVTGDIKYHTAVDILEAGTCAVDAGHFGTEKIIVPRLAEILSKRFSDAVILESESMEDPFKVF